MSSEFFVETKVPPEVEETLKIFGQSQLVRLKYFHIDFLGKGLLFTDEEMNRIIKSAERASQTLERWFLEYEKLDSSFRVCEVKPIRVTFFKSEEADGAGGLGETKWPAEHPVSGCLVHRVNLAPSFSEDTVLHELGHAIDQSVCYEGGENFGLKEPFLKLRNYILHKPEILELYRDWLRTKGYKISDPSGVLDLLRKELVGDYKEEEKEPELFAEFLAVQTSLLTPEEESVSV
jgi:hypothetical protein